jgi:hypothetical protein
MNRFLKALLLVGFVAGCGDDSAAPIDVSPTTPGTGTGTGVSGGHGPGPVGLGPEGSTFVILAASGISTTGTTHITGDIGVSPAAATTITGFDLSSPPTTFTTSALVTGSVFGLAYDAPTPARLGTAVTNMQAAYTDAAGRTLPDHTELASGNIGGLTLPAGLYKWSSNVTIPTTVTLTGGAEDTWIFQIAGNLTQASATRVNTTGGALARNVTWQVAGIATIGTTAYMQGRILSQTQIILRTGATVDGKLLAQTQVVLDANTIVVK